MKFSDLLEKTAQLPLFETGPAPVVPGEVAGVIPAEPGSLVRYSRFQRTKWM